jgi:protein-tyrosine phosphatase
VIDLHSHVLPGLDDGPRDVAGTLEILRAARDDGITAMAATPHVRADWPTTPEQMEAGVAAVNALDSGVEVLPGGELDLELARRFDDATLARFGLGGNPRLLLLEVPFVGWPLDLPHLLFDFAARGFTVLLAHPERSADVQEQPDLVRPLVDAGAYVQLTAGSLDGRLGRRPRATAQALLAAGLAHVVASDAHAPAVRAVGMQDAIDAVGDELGRWLTTDVPAALLAGGPLPPRPVTRRTMRLPWHR